MQNLSGSAIEEKRAKALEEYGILDTLPEKDFDDITKIASEICQTPISLITLIDNNRQWFKSSHGISGSETPREYSFCSHAIVNPDEVMIVPDSLKDERFKNNPYVIGEPHVIFYAGVPLVNPAMVPFGSLCVVDNKPRTLSESQISSLKALANQVVCQLELRKKIRLLHESEKEIKKANDVALEEKKLRIEQFSFITSHELRHEFSKILSFIHLAKIDELPAEEMKIYLQHIENAAHSMSIIIEKLNAKLNQTIERDNTKVSTAPPLSQTEEICLIDDDRVINLLNIKIIKKVLPHIPLKIFEDVDDGLLYITQNPSAKRFILLDLNFPRKSGWYFLDELTRLNITTPIIILSSSIDPDDHKKSKNYQNVLAFHPKPLTQTLLQNLG